MLRFKRSYIAVLHDTLMAAISFVLSLYLRLGENFVYTHDFLVESTLLFTFVCFCVFSYLKLYRGLWHYASIPDLIGIAKAVTLAILVYMLLMFMVTRLEGIPRSVMVINWMVLLVLLGGPRVLYRITKDRLLGNSYVAHNNDKRIPVLLIGINKTADLFLRYTANNKLSDYKVVAIVDNDSKKIGSYLHGVKIYGSDASIEQIIKHLKGKGKAPRRIVLTEDNLDGLHVRTLLERAESLGISLAKLPKLSDFTSGKEQVKVKPIAIEDLLGRAQQLPNLGRRESLIKGKKVLVTGAGGTIGGELCRQIANYAPKTLLLIDSSEYNLYSIDKELGEKHEKLHKTPYLADIRVFDTINRIIEQEQPDIVFHAAALKHVPLVELNITEGALTNIIGTRNIAQACLKNKIAKMVLISTDKAVNPRSVMGLTKRIAECYIHSLGSYKRNKTTIFSVVRFGNVLGSSGSVIPLFQSQLEKGGPLTVTHPEMTRYFMTVPEAVELVLQASTLEPKEDKSKSAIFILDMGTPIRIKDLAEQMIKLAGFTPDEDIKIEYTGVRKGEKLHEELFYADELEEKTEYETIMQAKSRQFDYEKIIPQIEMIEKYCLKGDTPKTLAAMSKLVPEFIYDEKN